MNKCDVQSWTLEDLQKALTNQSTKNNKIVVPMFQRGRRWGKEQQKKFIDSLLQGYPVGTMLFYKTIENSQETYILVDGLQRSNCIRKYLEKPTTFLNNDNIPEDMCTNILKVLSISDENEVVAVKSILTDYIQKNTNFADLQTMEPAMNIATKYGVGDFKILTKIGNIIESFFNERKNQYKQIADTHIPVVVYTGESHTLPIIFDRINSQGTPLSPYEVYAASWPNINSKFKVNNKEIVNYVVRKYQSFVDDGFEIHGYNRDEMEKKQEVNAFEFLLGLSRYLVNKYPELPFGKDVAEDEVNPFAFELVDACLNESKKINTLYENINGINVNDFLTALENAIRFVLEQVKMITGFKGNRRTYKVLHSKFQIMSMISTTFKEMYGNGNYKTVSDGWDSKKKVLEKTLPKYYVYDIITNYWSDGGTTKIYKVAKPNRYLSEISDDLWISAMDSYYAKNIERKEASKVASPGNEEYAILNCIYLKTFTAEEQLSPKYKYDIEHIAPKEQMKKFLAIYEDCGLPISSISNLCYLPEGINRAKGAKNFYQDKNYLSKLPDGVTINDVEGRYSFTKEDDLAWMDIDYGDDDFELLKTNYLTFCKKRFEVVKQKFLSYLGIVYTPKI